jgi:hypothetical protein
LIKPARVQVKIKVFYLENIYTSAEVIARKNPLPNFDKLGTDYFDELSTDFKH